MNILQKYAPAGGFVAVHRIDAVQPDLQSGCFLIFRQIANLPVRNNLPDWISGLPERGPLSFARVPAFLFYTDEFVLSAAQTYLFRMGKACLVFRIRVRIVEMVMTVMETRSGHLVSQLAARKRGLFQTCIHTSLVQGKRVE